MDRSVKHTDRQTLTLRTKVTTKEDSPPQTQFALIWSFKSIPFTSYTQETLICVRFAFNDK